MTTPPKVTVIVPIHGTEPYLEKCVRSILAQTFDAIEVICVDDVSPDNSAQLIASLALTDSRLTLIRHEQNLGQGGARNSALRVARGEYIANVDSDDWIKPTMIERLYGVAESDGADIVCCGYDRVDVTGDVIKQYSPEGRSIDNRHNCVDIFDLLNPALWNKLFRKRLCTDNDLTFPNYLNYEDLATTPRLVREANTITIINDRLYNYVSRKNSVVSTYSTKHVLDCFDAFRVLRRYLQDKQLFRRYQSEYLAMVDKHVKYRVDSLMRSTLSVEQKESQLRHIVHLKRSFLNDADEIESMTMRELQQSAISPLVAFEHRASMSA